MEFLAKARDEQARLETNYHSHQTSLWTSQSSHDTGADVWVDICTILSSLQMGAVGAYFLVGWWLLVHCYLSAVTLNANRHR